MLPRVFSVELIKPEFSGKSSTLKDGDSGHYSETKNLTKTHELRKEPLQLSIIQWDRINPITNGSITPYTT